MGAFFCVCVLPFKTKFLKKIIDEEMKMKMRERERERERSRLVALFSSNSVLLQSSTRRQKKKNLSLSPKALSPNPKSTIIILQNLFFACVNIYRVVSTQYN